ncbi:putative ion transport protein [Candidatus Nitrososphaera gargensis Ga9.2]|uniref:Putative ion transport protein n=1 Tax=Nitrososphaera gargensis (strain Ga9.2) TaxID=1237085 RepID=K0IN63_NITGG|nr:ion transporter [Candidatus Nitrososphaera gargensis]AFU58824.1 putative ion transport protein [Candidatus Nitrososphaera gargensis Ga9.2]
MEEKPSLPRSKLPSERADDTVVNILRGIVGSRAFDFTITSVILLQAVALALEATPALYSNNNGERTNDAARLFGTVHTAVVMVFIVEAGMRLGALCPKPQDYFKDGWNSFDFAVIVLSLIPVTGPFATIARLIRLLRVTRLVTKSKELRAIVSTLVRSIPSIFNILILLGMLFFIYAIIGYHLFSNVDPQRWSSFLASLTTLFQVITLEGWIDITEPIVSQLGPLYWLYFATFIVIGTFIIINLFISVIVRKSEEAYKQLQLESGTPLTQQEIAEELREIHRILEELERRISRQDDDSKNGSDRIDKN